MVAFIVLYLLFERAYPTSQTRTHVLILLSYALFIEIVQYFLPARTADPYDIIADATGILIATQLVRLLRRCRLCDVCYN